MMRQRFTAFLLMVLISLCPLVTVNAQGLPATPVPAAAPTGELAQFPLDVLPTPHAEVWFLRMGLAPGGSLPIGKQVGPLVAYVESGELTIVTDRPVTMPTGTGERATPSVPSASPVAGKIETVLRPGESVMVHEGSTLTASNDANGPTTFLVVLAFAGEREEESGDTGVEPVGLTQQGISVGVAEFPAGPGTLRMERVVVQPGDTLKNDSGHGIGIRGIELGAIEQGSAKATFVKGTSWLWPSMLNAFSDRQPIYPGSTIDLSTADGYSTFDGSSTWVVTSHEPLVLLRVVVTPDK